MPDIFISWYKLKRKEKKRFLWRSQQCQTFSFHGTNSEKSVPKHIYCITSLWIRLFRMIGVNDSWRFNFLVRILKNQCPTWYPKKKSTNLKSQCPSWCKFWKSVPKLVKILN
jgi:hypothetical protein